MVPVSIIDIHSNYMLQLNRDTVKQHELNMLNYLLLMLFIQCKL